MARMSSRACCGENWPPKIFKVASVRSPQQPPPEPTPEPTPVVEESAAPSEPTPEPTAVVEESAAQTPVAEEPTPTSAVEVPTPTVEPVEETPVAPEPTPEPTVKAAEETPPPTPQKPFWQRLNPFKKAESPTRSVLVSPRVPSKPSPPLEQPTLETTAPEVTELETAAPPEDLPQLEEPTPPQE